jgi:hypothetical protein
MTAVWREEAREVPVAAEVDVCIIGGGCTGVFAAVAAARLGARVALVENQGFFGGVATAGLVNIWHSMADTTGQTTTIAGLSREVVERLAKRRGVTFSDPKVWYGSFFLNTELLKLELDALVTETKVRPFLHARFCAPVLRDGRPVAAVIEDKTGRRAISAAFFVDASGDGDFVHRAGFECYTRSRLQPPTVCAILRGLREIKTRHPDFEIGKVAFDERYPNALRHGFLWHADVPGAGDERLVVGTRVFGADCSDADQLTAAELEGRRQVRAICDIVREHFQGPEGQPLVTVAPQIGIRETRHARCLHPLAEADLLGGRRFPDAIANGVYPVDVHHPDKPGITLRFLDGREVYSAPGVYQESRWLPEGQPAATFYQIPYRTLVPRGATNALVAGRVLDADPGAFGAVRVMVNCNQTGEAAGTACVLALQNGCSVAQVDPAALRATLSRQGSAVI